jgi:hypothetical protein
MVAFNEPEFDFEAWRTGLTKADIIAYQVALTMATRDMNEFATIFIGTAVVFGIPREKCLATSTRIFKSIPEFATVAAAKAKAYKGKELPNERP